MGRYADPKISQNSIYLPRAPQYLTTSIQEVIKSGAMKYHQETVSCFLPMSLNGIKVLVRAGGGHWLVTRALTALEGTDGLGYRQSKRLDDKLDIFAEWGSLVKGIDTGDGWLHAQVRSQAHIP